MYECTNCGGELRYEIKKKKLVCEHCKEQFEPENFERDLTAKEQDLREMKFLVCPVCGGEVSSVNLAAMTHCAYCGSTVVMGVQNGDFSRPDGIVPFTKTKGQVKKAYLEKAKKAVLAPSAMKKAEFLDSFQPIYMPFHVYHTKMKEALSLNGERTTRSGKYDVTRGYKLECTLKDPKRDICLDASSSFRDSISREIMPYDRSQEKPFSPAYMLGFYADRPDAAPKIYEEEAKELVSEAVFLDIARNSKKVKSYEPDIPAVPDDIVKQCGTEVTGTSLTMLPVWFLTWRRKNRVSYAVANGQTGEVAAEFPIDYLKFFAISGVIAAAAFLLLNVFAVSSARAAVSWTLVLSVLVLAGYWHEMRRLIIHTGHLDDRGHFDAGGRDEKGRQFARGKRKIKGARTRKRRSGIIGFFLDHGDFWLVLLVGAFQVLLAGGSESLFDMIHIMNPMVMICSLAVMIYVLAKSILFLNFANRQSEIFGLAGPLMGALLSLALRVIHPVDDWPYFAAAAVAIAGCLAGILLMVMRYNEIVTSPLPHFFERKREEALQEGDARARISREEEEQLQRKRAERRKIFRNGIFAAFGALVLLAAGLIIFSIQTVAERKAAQAEAAYSVELASGTESDGKELYTNASTGFRVYIEDGQELLTAEEEAALAEEMAPVTDFGNAAFVTVGMHSGSTADYAKEYYLELFGPTSGTIFMIDMCYREIYLYSGQDVYRVVTKSKATSITDNVYRLAGAGDYAGCAGETFRQVTTLLRGGKITETVRYLCNLLVAILIGLAGAYGIAVYTTRRPQADAAEIAGVTTASVAVGAVMQTITSERRKLHVQSSSGGGGGGGHSSGGGGGGFSGGGGGHGF